MQQKSKFVKIQKTNEMKVVLVGYGKMGKEIEKILLSRGHDIIGKATEESPLNDAMIKDADVAIDFSTPHSVLENIDFLLRNNIPTIVGTTGWNASYSKVKTQVESFEYDAFQPVVPTIVGMLKQQVGMHHIQK